MKRETPIVLFARLQASVFRAERRRADKGVTRCLGCYTAQVGLWSGSCYLTPLLGAWVADRWDSSCKKNVDVVIDPTVYTSPGHWRLYCS